MKRFVIFLIVLLACCSAFAATPPGSSTETPPPIHEEAFMLFFEKPPVNDFFFSNPTSLNDNYDTKYGVIFPKIDETTQQDGYPSTQTVGITYQLESKGTLNVYCNSKSKKSEFGELRMVHNSINTKGVDMAFKIFAADSAGVTGTTALKTVEKGTSAKNPIYSVTITAPMQTKEYRVIEMTITAPKDDTGYVLYSQGEYSGFIIIEFMPS